MIDLRLGDCKEILKSIDIPNMVFVTDPPFNIGYHYEGYKDRLKEDEYYSMLGSIFNDKPFVVIHYPESIYKIAHYTNRIPERVVSWVYNSNTGRQHRDIAFFGIKPDFKKVTQPYKNLYDKRVQQLIEQGKSGGHCMTGGKSTK